MPLNKSWYQNNADVQGISSEVFVLKQMLWVFRHTEDGTQLFFHSHLKNVCIRQYNNPFKTIKNKAKNFHKKTHGAKINWSKVAEVSVKK